MVTAETICGNAHQGSTLQLSCPNGRIISEIQFASFGNPKGACGSFQKGDFEASNSVITVKKVKHQNNINKFVHLVVCAIGFQFLKTLILQACLGKESCSIEASESRFGVNNFGNNGRLAVQAYCIEK